MTRGGASLRRKVRFNDFIDVSEKEVGGNVKPSTLRSAAGGKNGQLDGRRLYDVDGVEGALRRSAIPDAEGAACRRAKRLAHDLLSRGIDDAFHCEYDPEPPPGTALPAAVARPREWLIDSGSCFDIVGRRDLDHSERCSVRPSEDTSFWPLPTGPPLRMRP